MLNEPDWLTLRKTWRYFPNRHQALAAWLVSVFLYINLFSVLFKQTTLSGDSCGSLVRPTKGWPYGDSTLDAVADWFWANTEMDLRCPNTFNGRYWEFLFTLGSLAICGLALRRANKRMLSEHRESTTNL